MLFMEGMAIQKEVANKLVLVVVLSLQRCFFFALTVPIVFLRG